MKQISLLTATYNHPDHLYKLFLSLKKQTNQDFTWIIVNDGSENETDRVLKKIQSETTFELIVINQNNSGKSSSINKGLDVLNEKVKIITIIDDDEILFPDAIDIILNYYKKYKTTNCGVIHFNRMNENNEIIAKPEINEDFYMSYQNFKASGRMADGYIGYFTEKLGTNRFTITKGEKYVAPTTLVMKVTDKSELLWAKAALGKTEYLEGGITKQGRKLRIKNPVGMIEYCKLICDNSSSIKQKIIYSTMGYAYLEYIKGTKQKAPKSYYKLCRIPGIILSNYWKNKYTKEDRKEK